MIVLVGWGAYLLVNAAIMLAFDPTPTELALQAGAGLAAAAAGLLLWRVHAPRARAPQLSFATVVAAAGMAMAVVGVELGPWLIYIGLGMTALGLGGVVGEAR